MSNSFYDYVRGRSEAVPAGYTLSGMRAYRYLVYLGASQMVEANFPMLRTQLGEQEWRLLIEGFVRQSVWTSPYYGDLPHDFMAYLLRESAEIHA
ncbi:putative DNA-binding domain-containing protein [Comamonas nitrativorans]|uniref:DNA-binding domain-containing protein n=1 Tax=Comamonas nitrativorans TaxID=108437 RepID=A0ABV9GX65_9BURK